MYEFLIEILSEEIPTSMQRHASESFKHLVLSSFAENELYFKDAKSYYSARRIVLHVFGISPNSADKLVERKGPRLSASDQAKAGFMRKSGLKSLSEAKIVSDSKKGDYYVASIKKLGRNAEEVISECLPNAIRNLKWRKSMKWGEGSMYWVRPIQSILCVFGHSEGIVKPINFEIEGITVGNISQGHRFMNNCKIEVKRICDYFKLLKNAKVLIDFEDRKEIILRDARKQASSMGMELIDDSRLVEETAGLVEWPVVLCGEFDESFLSIPEEVIRTSIREHQKCFVLRNPNSKKLTNRFVLVTNIDAPNHGKTIISGNERVIAARLSDAKFFWESDLKIPLEQRLDSLEEVIFFESLGTVAERVRRIRFLSSIIAPLIGAKACQAERAARLCKADLVSNMVKEFPELQGIMGRYYSAHQDECPIVSDAIGNQYKPTGQLDKVPNEPVSVTLALADKLDILTGFWAIEIKPTGSRDPFALRRAAIGVISIILENDLRISLRPILVQNFELVFKNILNMHGSGKISKSKLPIQIKSKFPIQLDKIKKVDFNQRKEIIDSVYQKMVTMKLIDSLADDLLIFFVDRLKVFLREMRIRHDLIDAVLALKFQDDLALLVKRVAALEKFIYSQNVMNLLTGYKRAIKILNTEEKKDGNHYSGEIKESLLELSAEKNLAELLKNVRKEINEALNVEDFTAAIDSLAKLSPAVDDFFNKILVNCMKPEIRENRLKILNDFREVASKVADFSKINS